MRILFFFHIKVWNKKKVIMPIKISLTHLTKTVPAQFSDCLPQVFLDPLEETLSAWQFCASLWSYLELLPDKAEC